jgi:hypothetical protein
MASGSGNTTNSSQELVIYKPTTWDLVYTGEEVNCPSTTVCSPPTWISQRFSRLQKAEEDVTFLAEVRQEEDAMEIDISSMRNYYEALSKNAYELIWEITQNQSLETPLAEERFNIIVRDCQMFGNEIWTAIGGLLNDAGSKEQAHAQSADRINDDLRLLKAGGDYWKNAVQSWSQGQERRQDRLTEHVGQQIEEIRGYVKTRSAQTEQALAQQFHKELKKFEQQKQ